MQKELQIRVLPEVAGESHLLEEYIIDKEGLASEDLRHIEVLRRSIDARARQAYVNLKVRLYIGEEFDPEEITLPDYPNVS